jgi:hypothetical protein
MSSSLVEMFYAGATQYSLPRALSIIDNSMVFGFGFDWNEKKEEI